MTTVWTAPTMNSVANWTDSANWKGGQYPDNGVPAAGDSWTVTNNFGNIALNSNITIDDLTEKGGKIIGATIKPNIVFMNGLPFVKSIMGDVTTFTQTTLSKCCLNNFNLTIKKNFIWSGGEMVNVLDPKTGLPATGKTISEGVATITTGLLGGKYGLPPRLAGRTLENFGTMSLVDTAPPNGVTPKTGSLVLDYGSRIVNDGTFNITGNQSFELGFKRGKAPLPEIVNNRGTFAKTGGNGISSIPFNFFNNGGTVSVQAGTLKIGTSGTPPEGTYQQNNAAAKTLTSKGATLWATKDLDVTAGMIGGDGTIKSPNINLMGVVKDAAKMQGGDAPGTLSVVGNINFLSNSTLFVDLGGTIQGSPTNGYSFVTDDGNALLAGGDLDLEFIDGFQSLVTSANVFDILTSDNPIDGTFLDAPVNGDRVTTIDGSGSFQVYYLGDTVELRNFEATVSEPSTMALFASGLIMLGWRLKPKKHKPSRNVLGRIMQRHRRSSLHRNAAQAHVNDAGAVWNCVPCVGGCRQHCLAR